MSSNADFFINSILGENFFKSLEKVELWKMGTKTVIDHEEMKTALQIVPRALMSFLIGHLRPMQIGETKEISIPLTHGQPTLRVNKHEKDVYSGELEDSTEKYTSRKVAEFKYRSIPGIGLVIMSAFELYDIESLSKPSMHHVPEPTLDMVQKMIDDCLMMHELIGKVKDNQLSERDAIKQLMLAKLSESITKKPAVPLTDSTQEKKKEQIAELANMAKEVAPMSDPYFHGMANGLEVANSVANDKEPNFVEAPKKKGSPLKEFLDKRQGKLKKKEYFISMAKAENVTCPDCGQHIFKDQVFTGCVCYGDDGDKKVYLAKSENGMKVRFGRGWDPENIEMLLDVLRKKHG